MSSIRKVNDILEQRNGTHGVWETQARIAQTIKYSLDTGPNILTPSQAEAIEMIAVKMSRIVSGNPNLVDHWEDIAGYATLVAKELEDNGKHRGEGEAFEKKAKEYVSKTAGDTSF